MLDVEHDEVGLFLESERHRLGAVGSLGDHLEVRLGVEHQPQPFAHHRMVVGEQNPCSRRDGHGAGWGMLSLTSTPLAGAPESRAPLR